MRSSLFIFAALSLLAGSATAGPVPLMSPDWAAATCDAWNGNSTLKAGLGESGWAANSGDRGYKVMRIHRSDCDEAPKVELHIRLDQGEARCVHGGLATGAPLVRGVDYGMWATSSRWEEMGRGEYGAMKAMLTGRLKFDGPKGEAMSNMKPFGAFLKLVGAVDSDAGTCPAK